MIGLFRFEADEKVGLRRGKQVRDFSRSAPNCVMCLLLCLAILLLLFAAFNTLDIASGRLAAVKVVWVEDGHLDGRRIKL